MNTLAVCCSGHISPQYTEKGYEEILDRLIWAVSEFKNVKFFIYLSSKNSDGKNICQLFLNKLNPIASNIIEDKLLEYPDKFNKNKRSETNIENSLKMFHKIQECNKLKERYEKENNYEFKYTMRCRPDMFFMSKVEVPISVRLGYHKVAIPFFPFEDNQLKGSKADFYFIGTNKAINTISCIYDDIEILYDELNFFHPELLLGIYIKRKKIRLKEIKSSCFFIKDKKKMNGYRY